MSVIINKKACFCIGVVILNFLTGCEMMNSDYDCPLSASASCMPLHDMDVAVSQGVYPKENKDSSDITNREITNRDINTDADNNSVATKSGKNLTIGSSPKRTNEMVAKIWLAPFIDSKGDYHEQSVVYAVVKNSAWVNLPINSVTVKQ